MKYIAQSSPKTMPGALSRIIRTNGSSLLSWAPSRAHARYYGGLQVEPTPVPPALSGARLSFAFDLGAMHDSARGRVKGITAVHRAPVVPQDEIAYTPFVVPRELLASRVRP